MTHKYITNTTYTCDLCGKQWEEVTKSEDEEPRHRNISYTGSLGFTPESLYDSDYCEDCNKSYLEWWNGRKNMK